MINIQLKQENQELIATTDCFSRNGALSLYELVLAPWPLITAIS